MAKASSDTPMMTARKAVFQSDEVGKKRFQAIWTAYVVEYPKLTKGFEALQRGNTILRKLRVISTPRDGGDDSSLNRELRDKAMTLLLSDQEHGMLKTALESPEMSWSPAFGESVEDAILWFRDLPVVEVSEASMKK